jgi:Zn-dependent peptidase ImmA (M78 family)/transcriptional regulator with XRE-family HTH domain
MFNPSRLTLARHRRGLTKGKLAKLVRMTPLTISRYESGESQPSMAAIEELATALHFPPTFFAGPDLEAPSVDGVSFRALSKMTASQRDSALGAGTLAVALSDFLDTKFDLPAIDVPELARGIIDPTTAADMVRAAWGLGTKPIPNVVHLMESHGIRVFSLVEECRELDAFSFWQDGRPFICLNTMKTAEHSRFDAIHELGHLVLHRDHSRPRGRPEEQEAHAFASAFLMPQADVLAHAVRFPSFHDLVVAKRRWGVSVAALAHRLHKLNLLSDWHYRELCIEISRYGRMREPNSIQHELSQLLAKTLGALRSEGLGRAAVARELSIYPDELDSLVFGLAVSAIDGEKTEPSDEVERAPLRLV